MIEKNFVKDKSGHLINPATEDTLGAIKDVIGNNAFGRVLQDARIYTFGAATVDNEDNIIDGSINTYGLVHYDNNNLPSGIIIQPNAPFHAKNLTIVLSPLICTETSHCGFASGNTSEIDVEYTDGTQISQSFSQIASGDVYKVYMKTDATKEVQRIYIKVTTVVQGYTEFKVYGVLISGVETTYLLNTDEDVINPATEDTLSKIHAVQEFHNIVTRDEIDIFPDGGATISDIDALFDHDLTNSVTISIPNNGSIMAFLKRTMHVDGIFLYNASASGGALGDLTYVTDYMEADGTFTSETGNLKYTTDIGAFIPVNPTKQLFRFRISNTSGNDISFTTEELLISVVDNTATYDSSGKIINPATEESLRELMDKANVGFIPVASGYFYGYNIGRVEGVSAYQNMMYTPKRELYGHHTNITRAVMALNNGDDISINFSGSKIEILATRSKISGTVHIHISNSSGDIDEDIDVTESSSDEYSYILYSNTNLDDENHTLTITSNIDEPVASNQPVFYLEGIFVERDKNITTSFDSTMYLSMSYQSSLLFAREGILEDSMYGMTNESYNYDMNVSGNGSITIYPRGTARELYIFVWARSKDFKLYPYATNYSGTPMMPATEISGDGYTVNSDGTISIPEGAYVFLTVKAYPNSRIYLHNETSDSGDITFRVKEVV